MVGTLMINFVMAMTTGSRFSGGRTSYRSLQASKRLRGLARRSSALEHPGRSIAARAHDNKWHLCESSEAQVACPKLTEGDLARQVALRSNNALHSVANTR